MCQMEWSVFVDSIYSSGSASKGEFFDDYPSTEHTEPMAQGTRYNTSFSLCHFFLWFVRFIYWLCCFLPSPLSYLHWRCAIGKSIYILLRSLQATRLSPTNQPTVFPFFSMISLFFLSFTRWLISIFNVAATALSINIRHRVVLCWVCVSVWPVCARFLFE